MQISCLKISGFRSFGSEVEIPLQNKLTTFIGLNSSGKTAALEALRKMFGSTIAERELCRADFHSAKDEETGSVSEKFISIEVRIDFDERDEDAVPTYFSQMVVDSEGDSPYLRLRLEASWISSNYSLEGDIDSTLYFIACPEGEEESEDSKVVFPNHLRKLIQVIYVPAIRRPAEQVKFASGSILYRVLRRIKWGEEFKTSFDGYVLSINELFRELPEFAVIESSLKQFWRMFHKDERYKDSDLNFGGSDFESILKKLEVSFSPTGTHKSYSVDDLGEGYRSLFYLTLVCALLDVEEKLVINTEEIGIERPLLTLLTVEEPENHIAPQLLGRVVKILDNISRKHNSQVLLSSHTPAIVKRVQVESICHFRISEYFESEVNTILLPTKDTQAYKFVKEAVHNYPEIYFAKLVVIGEGDSEEVIFGRIMTVLKIDFDDHIITFAPLGHRFVNHIWALLSRLHIPYVTLLDLDLERDGGGWGRIKYSIKQLIKVGANKEELLKVKNGSILTDAQVDSMQERPIKIESIEAWAKRLENFNVFFSRKLDLDFLMLMHYGDFYKRAIPNGGGPQIPDKDLDVEAYSKKRMSSVQATLKSGDAIGQFYTEQEKEMMIWYSYHFLGRGKPSTHMHVLSNMDNEVLKEGLPEVFVGIFNRIREILNIKITEGVES